MSSGSEIKYKECHPAAARAIFPLMAVSEMVCRYFAGCSCQIIMHLHIRSHHQHSTLSLSQNIFRNTLTTRPDQNRPSSAVTSNPSSSAYLSHSRSAFTSRAICCQGDDVFHSQPSGEYGETDDTGMYPHAGKTGLQAIHATKAFIVKHHIFLADIPFFPKHSNQL